MATYKVFVAGHIETEYEIQAESTTEARSLAEQNFVDDYGISFEGEEVAWDLIEAYDVEVID